MIVNYSSNIKKIFNIKINLFYKFILLKYWKIFYFLIWWYQNILFPINFELFFKKYESRYNTFKLFSFINKSLHIKQLNFNKNLLNYLTFFVYKHNFNFEKKNFLKKEYVYTHSEILLKNTNVYKIKYRFYYNFYQLKYLN